MEHELDRVAQRCFCPRLEDRKQLVVWEDALGAGLVEEMQLKVDAAVALPCGEIGPVRTQAGGKIFNQRVERIGCIAAIAGGRIGPAKQRSLDKGSRKAGTIAQFIVTGGSLSDARRRRSGSSAFPAAPTTRLQSS